MRRKIRRQRPFPGGRERLSAGVETRIDRALDRLVVMTSCTRPLIVSTLLADALGIELDAEDRYDTWKNVKKFKRA